MTTHLSGPVAVKVLVQLGASVIKVEAPGGDRVRRIQGDVLPGLDYGAAFLGLHRGKRSLAIDLGTPGGRQVALDLMKHADVVVENLRAGAMDKFGLGYEDANAANPGIVYCSISGYGATGPMAGVPATDGAVQTFGGTPLLFPRLAGDPPAPSRILVADVPGGLFAAQAIVAALYARTRTGAGSWLDISLVESMLQMLPFIADDALVGRSSPQPAGANLSMLQTADGRWVFVQLPYAEVEARFLEVIARLSPDSSVGSDPRFATRDLRIRNRPEYFEAVRRAFKTRDQADWVKGLHAVGVPAAPLNTIEEVLSADHLRERGAVEDLRLPNGSSVRALGNPFHFEGSASAPDPAPPPPFAGQHNREVLREVLGYTDARISELAASGVLWSEPSNTAG